MSLDLDSWLQKLENRQPEHQMRLGTERMVATIPRLIGSKKIARQIITVAGTNGKGSCVAFLEYIFQAAGLRYGATCSPHLFCFNERIRLNGKPVSDGTLCNAFERIENKRGDTFLSYFEFGALAAFDIFAGENLDVVILETGLGGRLDAMNALDSDIAVITTVDLDHQQWLGHTVEDIAREKAGIYRKNTPAVYGELPVPRSVKTVISDLQAIPLLPEQQFFINEYDRYWDFQGRNASGEKVILKKLPKSHLPLTSAVCAVQSVLMLKEADIKGDAIRKGLSEATLPGRNQCLDIITSRQQRIKIRLDVAHNRQASTRLSAILKSAPVNGKRIALVAVLDDKDFREMLAPLSDAFDQWYVSTAACKQRARDGRELHQWLQEKGMESTFSDTVGRGLNAACCQMQTGDELVVFGSFYTVSEVFPLIKNMIV